MPLRAVKYKNYSSMKPKQEEKMFGVDVRRGAYGTHMTYEPVEVLPEAEAETETVDTREQDLGEFVVSRTGLEQRRERFKEKTEESPWTPRTKYEMTLALQTLPIAIGHIAEHMPRRNQTTARRMYEAALQFNAEAHRALHDIEDAFVLEGDTDPSISRIRGEYHIRMMVAEHLLARESFDELHWLARKGNAKSAREKRMQKIMLELEQKSSLELLKDWEDARQSFQNEASFWEEQTEKVQDSRRVQEVQSENRSRRL